MADSAFIAKTLMFFSVLAFGVWLGAGAPSVENMKQKSLLGAATLLSESQQRFSKAFEASTQNDPSRAKPSAVELTSRTRIGFAPVEDGGMNRLKDASPKGKTHVDASPAKISHLDGRAPLSAVTSSLSNMEGEQAGHQEPSSGDTVVTPDPYNPGCSEERAWLLAEGPFHSKTDGERLVTLTFDDGPSSIYTPQILRILARYNIKATFFLIGKYLEGDSDEARKNRELAAEIVALGHNVGNHSYQHKPFTQMNEAQVREDLRRADALIERATQRPPIFLRPPYAAMTPALEKLFAEQGRKLVLWSAEAKDWAQSDVDGMFEAMLERFDYSKGGVALLHDWRPTSVELTDKLVRYLRSHSFRPKFPKRIGYRIVSYDEYEQATQKSPQAFKSRYDMQQSRRESAYLHERETKKKKKRS